MDNKQLKILQLLKEIGVGNPTNISPLLLTMFPGITTMDEFGIRQAASVIHQLLEDMKSQGWIEVHRYSGLGSGNLSNGLTWLDTVPINAIIKSAGIDKLDEELSKTDGEKLTSSIIDSNESSINANKSIQELNSQTSIFYSKQTSFNNLQKLLTIAITLSAVVSGAAATCTYYHTKEADQKKEQDKSDLQLKVTQLESTLKEKTMKDSAFQKAVKDSLRMP